MKKNLSPSIAQVIIPIPVDQPFTYRIPEQFSDLIRIGVQVVVPFGNRFQAGIVVSLKTSSDRTPSELKAITDVVNPEPFAGSDLMKLMEWISNYYVCNLGEAYRLINLSLNLQKSRFQVKRIGGRPSQKISKELNIFLDTLPEDSWTGLDKIEATLQRKHILYRIHQLRKRGLVETRYLPPRMKRIFRTEALISLIPVEKWSQEVRDKFLSDKPQKPTFAQKLVKLLLDRGEIRRSEIRSLGFSSSVIQNLRAKGILRIREEVAKREQEVQYFEEPLEVELSDQQKTFVDRVSALYDDLSAFRVFLLHGITGSGKTQIYIELIARAIQKGRQAIVLIPEIVLTPQTMARFRHYFKERVAVIHSRLSVGEKVEVLQRIRNGDFDVVVGPRSAIFAPLNNLGIIIVDEEHESSYKQSDAVPRYHARDVALYRAQLNNIPVVLGSATPSFESLRHAMTGKYEYFHLSQRISSRNLPRTLLVDLKEEWRRTETPPLLSENLELKIESRIVSREQVMLLQNRRGFAPYILCKDCGFVAKCPNCEITLTYHFKGKILLCHYCGHQEQAPDTCPDCQGLDILFKGVGTQKIEQAVMEKFPHIKVLRMDLDTTSRKHDHARILEKFRNGDADLLIGTKMIAKGLDFERVTLVGIISADQGLNFPDFRASEKVFQLLTQAAGRAGRGASSGEVIIQTFDPGHYIFKFLDTHDYRKFYEREIQLRQTLNYPPFSRLCLIRIIGDEEKIVQHYGQKIAKFLWKANPDKKFTLLGPAPAPLVKLNNKYRYQILIKQKRELDPSMAYVRRLLKEGLYKNPELRKWPVKIQIDVDPFEIM